jgi:hypothetical protein
MGKAWRARPARSIEAKATACLHRRGRQGVPEEERTMIVTTKDLFKVAYGKFAIGAYNINNMEQCIGLFQGNIDSQAPFIIQISRGARSYARVKMLEGLIRSAEEVFPDAIFGLLRLHRLGLLQLGDDRRLALALR